MSTHSRILAIASVVLASYCGVPSRARAWTDEPRQAAPAPSSTAAVPQERFLLLNDGRLVPGIVSERAREYLVTQRAGTMRFPKRAVEALFNSLREAYEYKLRQLPEHDPDERMKLARWCLNQKLTTQAKEQLACILQVDPDNGPAQAMLTKIGQEEARLAFRRDPEVQQARADGMPRAGALPATLDSSMVDRAASALKIPSSPVIFDLPRPLAIKRTNEFFQFIHPMLQAQCAKCHNGDHNGKFQLVPIKTKLDRTPDALRHNLDVALLLVNRGNPGSSELLTSTLRPHGGGPNPRPIYPGSNDRSYQILAAWVNGLRAPRTPGDDQRTEGDGPSLDQTVPFAADRARVGQGSPDRGAAAQAGQGSPAAVGSPEAAKASPSSGSVAELGIVVPLPDRDPAKPKQFRVEGIPLPRNRPELPERDWANPKEFPLPFAVSGVKAATPTGNAAPGAAAQPSTPPSAGAVSPSRPASAPPAPTRPDATKKPASPGPAEPASKTQTDVNASKKPAKPVKIDSAALEQMLLKRNQSR
jgi:hypothetical protein